MNGSDTTIKVTDDITLEEVNPTYVYMIIPANYACTYHKLLVMLADFGVDMLNDCSATCKGNNKNIINCWNMFQAACAAHQLGRDKEADVLINYINGQLKLIYSASDKEPYDGTTIFPIDEEGKLKAIVTCEDAPKFYVDADTGGLIGLTDADKKYTHTVLLDDGDGY